MKKVFVSLTVLASVMIDVAAMPAQAQTSIQQIGLDPWGQPLCSGPLGPGRCADIFAWMQRGGTNQPQPAPFGGLGSVGPAGIPTGIVPRDGQIAAMIAQQCGPNPACAAGAWGSVEVQRCANGVGVPGGCFGPNGEIMKVINRFVPQNLQPNVILHNAWNDVTQGPGENNDLVGKKGWVCRTFLGGC